MSDTSAVLWFFGLLAAAGGAHGLISIPGNAVRPEVAKSLSGWLSADPAIGPGAPLAKSFILVFDATFGPKKLSPKFFLISTMFSFATFSMLGLAWATFRHQEFLQFQTDQFLQLALVGFCIVNIVPDYLSACQNRYVFGRLENETDWRKIVGLVVVDALLTIAISIAILFPLTIGAKESMALFGELRSGNLYDITDLFVLKGSEIQVKHPDVYPPGWVSTHLMPPFGVFFYTTCFTSVWIWLYAISGLIAKLLIAVRTILNLTGGFSISRTSRSLALQRFRHVLARQCM